nr:hypothetical transcript [Hymenolepis microstoma]
MFSGLCLAPIPRPTEEPLVVFEISDNMKSRTESKEKLPARKEEEKDQRAEKAVKEEVPVKSGQTNPEKKDVGLQKSSQRSSF